MRLLLKCPHQIVVSQVPPLNQVRCRQRKRPPLSRWVGVHALSAVLSVLSPGVPANDVVRPLTVWVEEQPSLRMAGTL